MLCAELAQSRSFYARSLYIDMCTMSFDLYSRAFFKLYFAEALLGLYSDAVPNIRLRLCRLLPQIHRAVRPTDKQLKVLLDNCTQTLYANEKDCDVIAEWKKVCDTMQCDMIRRRESLTWTDTVDNTGRQLR